MDKEAFKIFAELHPIEAYELNKEMFYEFYREKTLSTQSDSEIDNFIAYFKVIEVNLL